MPARTIKPHSAKIRRRIVFRRLLLRALLVVVLCGGVGALALKQFGNEIVPPAVDAARGVLGPEAVAWLESTVYGAADMVQRARQNMGLQQAEQAPWTTADSAIDTSVGQLPPVAPTAATPLTSGGSRGEAAPPEAATVTTTPTLTPTPTATKTPTASATPTVQPTKTALKAKATRTRRLPTVTPRPRQHTATPSPTEDAAAQQAATETTIAAAPPTETAAPPTETTLPQAEPTQPLAPVSTVQLQPATPTQPPAPTPTHPIEDPPPAAPGAPASLAPFIYDGQLPGEGVWSSDGLPQPQGGAPVFWKTVLRPNPDRPYAQVYMVSFDPRYVKLHMVAGQSEPVSAAPVYRGTQIDPADYGALVASFNGGWKSVHGAYGMMVNGVQIAPPSPNAATLAIHADGRLELGPWTSVGKATDLVSYRQNCPMLIDNGVLGYDKHTTSTWGLSLLDEMYVWRSGLGMTADGRLIYVAGNPISAEEMAWALQRAGAVNAMQLDINSAWVHWVIYDHSAKGDIRARPLVSTMTVSKDQYLKPVERDFFYITWR